MERDCGDGIKGGNAMRRLLRNSEGGICLAILGLGAMAFGVYRGEMPVVLEKAINICMECIGIG